MPAAVAARLGLKTSGDRLIADLVSYLRAKRLLLVLDNVEQLTGGAPLLARLLTAHSGCDGAGDEPDRTADQR